jgi:hypothetical protein
MPKSSNDSELVDGLRFKLVPRCRCDSEDEILKTKGGVNSLLFLLMGREGERASEFVTQSRRLGMVILLKTEYGDSIEERSCSQPSRFSCQHNIFGYEAAVLSGR